MTGREQEEAPHRQLPALPSAHPDPLLLSRLPNASPAKHCLLTPHQPHSESAAHSEQLVCVRQRVRGHCATVASQPKEPPVHTAAPEFASALRAHVLDTSHQEQSVRTPHAEQEERDAHSGRHTGLAPLA